MCIFARLNHVDKLNLSYFFTFWCLKEKDMFYLRDTNNQNFTLKSAKKSARFSSLIVHFLNVSFLQKTFKSKYVSDLKVMASVNLFTRLCLTRFGANRFLPYWDYVRVGLTTITLDTPGRTVTCTPPLTLWLYKRVNGESHEQVSQTGIFNNVCWQSHQMSKCAYK